MTIRITEDEDEPGGHAYVDLGRPLRSPLLSFRRQDTEPRHLGADGWQPEVAWLTPLSVTERDGRAVARFGPSVIDRIEELVPIEIVAQDGTSFGVVAWPFIAPAPGAGGILAGTQGRAPAVTGTVTSGADAPPAGAIPEPVPDVAAEAGSAATQEAEAPARTRRRIWPMAALPLLAFALAAGGGAYLYTSGLPSFDGEYRAPQPSTPPVPASADPEPPRPTAAELQQRFTRLIDARAPASSARPPSRRDR
jgi:hypothetical protein